MFVSLLARYNAIAQMNQAQYNLMQNSMFMSNMCRNLAFTGHRFSPEALCAMDTRLAISNAQNELLYQIAYAQEQAAAKRIAQEHKDNKLSLTA